MLVFLHFLYHFPWLFSAQQGAALKIIRSQPASCAPSTSM